MSPEERAIRLVRQMEGDEEMRSIGSDGRRRVATSITAEIRDAVLDERKACVKFLSDEVFKILGSGHARGREAAHEDAKLVAEIKARLEAARSKA